MHIFHVGRCEHAVLLGCEIDREGEGGDPARGGVCDAHFCGLMGILVKMVSLGVCNVILVLSEFGEVELFEEPRKNGEADRLS